MNPCYQYFKERLENLFLLKRAIIIDGDFLVVNEEAANNTWEDTGRLYGYKEEVILGEWFIEN